MRIDPVPVLDGHIAVPGDKSISHRAVLVGSLCKGETRIVGFGRSTDTETTIEAVRALGVGVEEHDVDTLTVHGIGLEGMSEPAGPIETALSDDVLSRAYAMPITVEWRDGRAWARKTCDAR